MKLKVAENGGRWVRVERADEVAERDVVLEWVWHSPWLRGPVRDLSTMANATPIPTLRPFPPPHLPSPPSPTSHHSQPLSVSSSTPQDPPHPATPTTSLGVPDP